MCVRACVRDGALILRLEESAAGDFLLPKLVPMDGDRGEGASNEQNRVGSF